MILGLFNVTEKAENGPEVTFQKVSYLKLELTYKDIGKIYQDGSVVESILDHLGNKVDMGIIELDREPKPDVSTDNKFIWHLTKAQIKELIDEGHYIIRKETEQQASVSILYIHGRADFDIISKQIQSRAIFKKM